MDCEKTFVLASFIGIGDSHALQDTTLLFMIEILAGKNLPILVIKILVIECQEVNAHVHLTVYKFPRNWRNGEFLWECNGAWLPQVWTATSGERLKCARKIRNRSDLVAVAVHFGFHFLVHYTNHRWLKVFVDWVGCWCSQNT